ncbi:hypothetical protein E2C01_046379 [Portunus trituberculatus]|uniref:Uncharacterized protein n=1 Tax=Portunus trituberculatus TaxID=210409 RepID=A0A5B7G5U6_PORTR|nr:hypothetical protein [Portunus trituberculatus]
MTLVIDAVLQITSADDYLITDAFHLLIRSEWTHETKQQQQQQQTRSRSLPTLPQLTAAQVERNSEEARCVREPANSSQVAGEGRDNTGN